MRRPKGGSLGPSAWASAVVAGAVADAAYGLDQVLVLGSELGAQAPHVDIDRAGASVEVVAPDLAEQPGTRIDPPGVLRQEPEQLELLQRQVERPSARGHAKGLGVDRERAQPHHGAVSGAGTAPEHRQAHTELRFGCAWEHALGGD